MTKEKYPNPKYWVSIELCETIYNTYKKLSAEYKLAAPVPSFDSRYNGVLEAILSGVQLKGSLIGLSISESAATYFVRLSKSQAFFDANKRMAVIITNMFLIINGYELEIPPNTLRDLALLLSRDSKTSIDKSVELVLRTFEEHIKPIRKS
jgi:death-on-curing family protein